MSAELVAQDLVVLVVGVAWGVAETTHGSTASAPKSGRPQSGSTGIVLGITMPLGILGAILAAVFYQGDLILGHSWWPIVFGTALMAAGVALRRWALRYLGQWFSTVIRIQDGQTVVREGPYRWIRHPSYAGPILSAVGLGLALGTWSSLGILTVCFLLGYGWRIHHEENVLLAGMGDEYRAYCESTARLVPGVW